MSHVTNMMVSASPDDYETVQAFSEWLRNEAPLSDGRPGGCGYLLEITGENNQWGGWKHPECDVWAGTLNHADLAAVLGRVRQTAWKAPNELQIFLQDQHEAFFRLWMIRDGELRQYTPTRPVESDPDFFPPDLDD